MSLVVLADRAEDEEKWKSARRKAVTASDCVHLMGAADKHWLKTPEELAAEKRGSGSPSSQLMQAGSFWEGPILSYLDEILGLETEPETVLIQDPSLPFLACSPDAWLGYGESWAITRPRRALEGFLHLYQEGDAFYGEEAVQRLLEALAKARAVEMPSDGRLWWEAARCLVEVKNQASKDRPKWNKPSGPPKYYECQCQAQMAVIPVDFVLLAAKVDANEIFAHVVARDDFFIELLVDTARAFHEEYLAGR